MQDFEAFYAASSRQLLRALVLVTGDAEDARDCLQEAYIRAAARWRRISALDSPEAWVRRVALNLATDGWRRRSVRARWGREASSRATTEPPDPASVDIVRSVRELPAEQRDVIVRHYLLDMSVDAVARELGRPEGTAKTQLARGRARLAGLLALVDEEA